MCSGAFSKPGGGAYPQPCHPRYQSSAGGVQPAHRRPLARVTERLEFGVPWLTEQAAQRVLQTAAAVRGVRHCRAQPCLRDEDVAIAARHRGEEAKARGVAVANGVAALARLLGDL